MMKVTLALVFLAVVWVSANPHGNSKEDSSEHCASTDSKCKCHELLEPSPKPSKAIRKSIRDTCNTQLGVTSSGHHAPVTNEMKNCLILGLMKNNTLLNASGNIDSAAATTYYTNALNTNKNEVPTVTTAQIQAIIASISTCATQAAAATLPGYTFEDCLNTSCVTALA